MIEREVFRTLYLSTGKSIYMGFESLALHAGYARDLPLSTGAGCMIVMEVELSDTTH